MNPTRLCSFSSPEDESEESGARCRTTVFDFFLTGVPSESEGEMVVRLVRFRFFGVVLASEFSASDEEDIFECCKRCA